MPSIFNHENACWGVKKPFSNLLQCDFNDDLQIRKIRGLVNHDLPNSSNSVKYSVSSNGYYGYQPHSSDQNLSEPSDDNAMDIDVNNIPVSPFLQSPQLSKPFVLTSYPDIKSVGRKRQLSGDPIENNKRMRHQDAGAAEISSQTPTCSSHQGDGVGSRLRLLRGQFSQGGENERTAELLRLTHGCEVYLYERSCDY